MWVADKVDDALIEYRERHGIQRPWETRERVVVALTGAPHGEEMVRRAARIAARTHGELIGVHVRTTDGLSAPDPSALDDQRALLADLEGEYHELASNDIARSLVQFARARNATQIVLGATHRSRWGELTRGSIVNAVVRNSGPIDVHVISIDPDAVPAPPARVRPPRARRVFRMTRRRSVAGWTLAVGGPLLTVLVLAQLREHLELPSDLLVLMLVVVVVAAVGGLAPALVAAIGSFLLANWFFVAPYHTWKIAEAENVLALVIFVSVASIVSFLVAQATRRTAEAAQARADAETLAALAGAMTSSDDPLPAIAAQLCSTFDARGVSVLRRRDGRWVVEAAAGDDVAADPEHADRPVPIGHDTVIALSGRNVRGVDAGTLDAFTGQVALALERRRLRAEAERAVRLVEVNELRAGLLAAVSHDLRTPLASIKASVSSLRQRDITWSQEDHDEFLASIEEGVDRLTALVTNLLGMSRIHAGQVELALQPVALDEVVAVALSSIEHHGACVELQVGDDLSAALADPALLERVVANVVDNACKWSPPGVPVTVRGSAHDDRVMLFVIDHGPGIPQRDRERVFEPFQRLGDNSHDGTGLGLAVARGFVELMDGELVVDDTPGGGTTMEIALPVAR
jgi:two-component system sensor histidine kinase KdpD